MRADVNVSVRKHGEPYRTRCEVKNVNSIRFVMQAIEAEAKRQVEVWEAGGAVEQETRLFEHASRRSRARCAARKTRMITAISLIRICCRWCWMRTGSPS